MRSPHSRPSRWPSISPLARRRSARRQVTIQARRSRDAPFSSLRRSSSSRLPLGLHGGCRRGPEGVLPRRRVYMVAATRLRLLSGGLIERLTSLNAHGQRLQPWCDACLEEINGADVVDRNGNDIHSPLVPYLQNLGQNAKEFRGHFSPGLVARSTRG